MTLKRVFCVIFGGLVLGVFPWIPSWAAAPDSPDAKKTAVAVVNGVEITARELELNLESFLREVAMKTGRKASDQEIPGIKSNLLEEMINQELLYQAALEEKIPVDEEQVGNRWSQIQKQMENDPAFRAEIDKTGYTGSDIQEQIRKSFLVGRFIREKFLDPVKVSDDEVKNFYETRKKEFVRPEQVRAEHILIKPEDPESPKSKAAARKKITEIKKKLHETKDFEGLAQEYSQCPSGKNGGDLGFFGRGEMSPPFEEAAFSLNVNDISDIVETQFGYHLIKVTGKTAQTTVSFDEVKEDIRAALTKEKADKAKSDFLDAKKKSAKIELHLQ